MAEHQHVDVTVKVDEEELWAVSLLKVVLDRVLILLTELDAEFVRGDTISKRTVNELLNPVREAVAACHKWPHALPGHRQMGLLVRVFRLAALMQGVVGGLVPAQMEIQEITDWLLGVQEKGTVGEEASEAQAG